MNKHKDIPFTLEQLQAIITKHPTPFHIYDEKGIVENARRLNDAFSWAPGFRNHFAVKATPNPYLIDLLRKEGQGVDCSSLPELLIAENRGLRGEKIMFTSNNTPASEFKKASALGAIINLDDITHIPFLEQHAGIPDLACLRYNPGPMRQTAEGNVIGKPEEAKFGQTKQQLLEAYSTMRKKGSTRFGLHTMLASNELNPNAFIQTANMLFDLVLEVHNNLGIKIEFVNLGGGVGIPYKPEQEPVNLKLVSDGIKEAYETKITANGLAPLRILMETGRLITGPHGYLITTAIHEKSTYRDFIGVDASMADLMRPGMYRAFHFITVMGKDNTPEDHIYDIVGSLCENNDKFAEQRALPKIEMGDILVIHNAGAHGHSMGFNYNGKLRSAELLLKETGEVVMIRRAETIDDYFATLRFPGATIRI
jgi:diaminopimelate decarboxylase